MHVNLQDLRKRLALNCFYKTKLVMYIFVLYSRIFVYDIYISVHHVYQFALYIHVVYFISTDYWITVAANVTLSASWSCGAPKQ